MASILLVAHAPLASTLQAIARHPFAECGGSELAAVDIPASADLDEARALVAAALQSLPQPEVLILTDVFGATPCNAAHAVADVPRWRVVAGVNVPMLWRALCYAQLPVGDLVVRAVDGGHQGIVQGNNSPPQNQPPGPSHDPDANPDQQ